ncbi:tRNA hydroxylase [Candidatus Endobugula sertula]|uniref:tRNA hydroxylase n=1 Tax=Candidatus Endobugula sertula TaxID=62101 RepID=A0A1D2QN43_9GAMM|nr:tRNA hydroxylase [Candidatus Endobugula sertula]
MTDIRHIQDFLLCKTPQAWVDNALDNIELMLIDHANCEKKAASTALNLMYRYVDNFELLNKMSRLAREELRHFEQVIAIMKKRGIAYPHIEAARYAAQLRKEVRASEPYRLIDTLIVGAIIEARSCERFAVIAPVLDDDLSHFYLSLLKSEARHYQDYLTLAETATSDSIKDRVAHFLQIEQRLIETEDTEFRFHSGPTSPLA